MARHFAQSTVGIDGGAALAAILVACTVPADEQRRPDLTAENNRLLVPTAIANPPAAFRLGPGDCGRLCDNDCWERANPAEVRAQLDLGADLAATDGDLGGAALHVAAAVVSDPDAIATLLEAGGDIEAVNAELGATPLHLAGGVQSGPPCCWTGRGH